MTDPECIFCASRGQAPVLAETESLYVIPFLGIGEAHTDVEQDKRPLEETSSGPRFERVRKLELVGEDISQADTCPDPSPIMPLMKEDRSPDGLRAGFIQCANTVFADGYAPLYERFSREVAEVPDLLALAAPAQLGQYPAYLLFAAVQYLLLGDPSHPLADYYASLRAEPLPPDGGSALFREFCRDHRPEILDLVASRLVQTNEVGRSACLAPAFSYVASVAGDKPLHLIEVGTAAGLNLLFDRYLLSYDRFQWGDPSSRVHIHSEMKGDHLPPLDGWHPRVAHRVGVDLNPIDVTVEEEARWLRALVWPEQTARANLLAEAMAVAAQAPPKLLTGDAVDLLPGLLAEVPADETACVFQSYTLEYFSLEARTKFSNILESFGADRDLYFVQMYGIGEDTNVRLTAWRRGKSETVQLAACQPHGQWLRWLL